jgi:hypothetical protein
MYPGERCVVAIEAAGLTRIELMLGGLRPADTHGSPRLAQEPLPSTSTVGMAIAFCVGKTRIFIKMH